MTRNVVADTLRVLLHNEPYIASWTKISKPPQPGTYVVVTNQHRTFVAEYDTKGDWYFDHRLAPDEHLAFWTPTK